MDMPNRMPISYFLGPGHEGLHGRLGWGSPIDPQTHSELASGRWFHKGLGAMSPQVKLVEARGPYYPVTFAAPLLGDTPHVVDPVFAERAKQQSAKLFLQRGQSSHRSFARLERKRKRLSDARAAAVATVAPTGER